MGKFERRLRKSVKDETPKFEEWYVKNEERLKESGVPVDNGRAAAIKRRRLLPLLCALGTVIVLLAVLLPVLLTQSKRNEFRFYFDSEIGTRVMTAEEEMELKQHVAVLNRMENFSGRITYHREKGTAVFVQFTSEVEYDDYFLCDSHILLDNRYHYFAQSNFVDLPNRVEGENCTVTYGQKGQSDIGLYKYCVSIEYPDVLIYMDVQCFDGNITELIEQCIMAK